MNKHNVITTMKQKVILANPDMYTSYRTVQF